jgi:hypothetical protein
MELLLCSRLRAKLLPRLWTGLRHWAGMGSGSRRMRWRRRMLGAMLPRKCREAYCKRAHS